jgi:hypothetical protein
MPICSSCFWVGVASGEVLDVRRWGVRRAVVGRDVQGRKRCGLDTRGSEAEQHTVNVPRIRQVEGALGAVEVEGEAQKRGRGWARLDLV